MNPAQRHMVEAVSLASALIALWMARKFWTAKPVQQPSGKLANQTPDQIKKKLRTAAILLIGYALILVGGIIWLVNRGH